MKNNFKNHNSAENIISTAVLLRKALNFSAMILGLSVLSPFVFIVFVKTEWGLSLLFGVTFAIALVLFSYIFNSLYKAADNLLSAGRELMDENL